MENSVFPARSMASRLIATRDGIGRLTRMETRLMCGRRSQRPLRSGRSAELLLQKFQNNPMQSTLLLKILIYINGIRIIMCEACHDIGRSRCLSVNLQSIRVQ